MPDVPQAQITDAKLDQQTGLLRWILGGVGAAVVGGASWMASQFAQDKTFLRDDLKAVLVTVVKSQETANTNQALLVKAVENNTKAVEGLRDDTRLGVWRAVEPPTALPAR